MDTGMSVICRRQYLFDIGKDGGECVHWLWVKVLVRQISTGLYWKSGTGWVAACDGEVFADSAVALLYCVANEMRDVHVVLSFDDPRYDVVLHPFGEKGNELTTGELIDRGEQLKKQSDAATAVTRQNVQQMKDLLAGAEQSAAAMKERKKQIPFGTKTSHNDTR